MLKGESDKKADADNEAWRRRISADWYAPPLTAGDVRPLRLIQGIERIVPWAGLDYWVPEGSFGPRRLADRDSVLNAAGAAGRLPLIGNKDARKKDGKRAITISHIPRMDPESAVKLKFSVWLPPEPDIVERAADLAAAMGTAMDAFWGTITPGGAAGTIVNQRMLDSPGPERPPPGLPPLALPERLDPFHVPYFFGWVNYWSKETAERIGFPDPARHAELLERARRLENGAWVVQLTNEPLDIYFRPFLYGWGSYIPPEEPRDQSNPAHLRALARAYEVLPAIGGRDLPPVPMLPPRSYPEQPPTLQAQWYAPHLTPRDGRLLRVVQEIERILPWADIRYDPARHAELLDRSRKLENGAWVVQLTDEPLHISFRPVLWSGGKILEPDEPRDRSNPEHKRVLARAYELLPAIGGRDKLAQPHAQP